MCGIFGIVSERAVAVDRLRVLASHARQRGRDSSGLMVLSKGGYEVYRADYDISRLLRNRRIEDSTVVMGHSRLITNGQSDNQPVVRDGVCLLHNGIVVNVEEVWSQLSLPRELEIDSEAIVGVALQHLSDGGPLSTVVDKILAMCRGTMSCVLVFPAFGKAILFSNNGSLYVGSHDDGTYFSSEEFPLTVIGCRDVVRVVNGQVELDIPVADAVDVHDDRSDREDLIPVFKRVAEEEAMLLHREHRLRRCSKCILPETMPYICFDTAGVCNYCNNYTIRNTPKPRQELFRLVEGYRRQQRPDSLVPFSGGRDSCYALHLIVKELKMTPITYTYDWGMVTDLGRRNISRVCSMLGVENIIVAADISKKRRHIRENLKAWLKKPNLGMVSILTAGDKHFFRHVETVKRQTGIGLNLWGVNPLEVTHFKAGFLGVPPDFAESRVYYSNWTKQLRYQWLRLKAMAESPGYFNSSLWDTLSGEYYRSFHKKSDYFHIFDYWRWDEEIIDRTLLEEYDWERAPDTTTTWRIGDGTAAFYNYIYYLAAGFTEHDTFRSNQIREGQMSRDRALQLVSEENRPRYQNIRWYLDAVGLDYKTVIPVVNNMPRLY
jgi:glucosamine--fructose-6-phosphate aminotransferase (isomerizing)